MTEAEKEREAIVAWLRGQQNLCRNIVRIGHKTNMMNVAGQAGSDAVTFAICADAIARGDHLNHKDMRDD